MPSYRWRQELPGAGATPAQSYFLYLYIEETHGPPRRHRSPPYAVIDDSAGPTFSTPPPVIDLASDSSRAPSPGPGLTVPDDFRARPWLSA